MSLPRTPDSPFSQASTEVPSLTANLADDVTSPVPGWPTLAKVIAGRPDLEAFASFRDLNIKSLLYYQAELIHLRKLLHKEEWACYRQTDDEYHSGFFAENLSLLVSARDDSIEDEEPLPQQWVLIEKIRTTLKKYNAALIQFTQLQALREADSGNVKTLKGCVKKAAKDKFGLASPLVGVGACTWGDTSGILGPPPTLPKLFWGLLTGFFVPPDGERKPPDKVFPEHLIVPSQEKKPDGLTQWVTGSFIPFYDEFRKAYLLPFFHLIFPPWKCLILLWNFIWRKLSPMKVHIDEEKRASVASSATLAQTATNVSDATRNTNATNTTSKSSESNIVSCITEYSGNWILHITSLMTTVVACLLPTVAITVLSRVHSMGLILGLITLFTAIFAAGLVLLSSSSSRVEIFTATAAFSAVMVVFVQNQIGSQQVGN